MSAQATEQLRRQAEQALGRGEFEAAHRYCIEILQRDPEYADGYFLLGMIAAAHGNVKKALELVDRALSRTPDRAEYIAHKARCLLLLNRTSDALEAARHALQLAPDEALTLDTIGVVLSKAGDHDRAAAAFELAVAKRPEDTQFHFNLGSSLQFIGRFEDAANSYETAIELQPDFYRAHWALSELAPPTRGAARIERMENLLDRVTENAEGRRYLCHALAKEHERLGHYSQAFEFWRRGKQTWAESPADIAARNRALFKEIIATCSADFVSAAPGHPSPEPIFVVGMPRTGTTLVERMIGSLEAVYPAGELDDFGLSIKKASGTTSIHILDVETVRAARNLEFEAVGRDYIERTRPRTGHTARFIDKLPPNFLYAGFIHRALPQAKIVCIVRNPLDTCLSNFRQLFSTRSSYYAYAADLLETGRYYLLFRELVRHWQAVLPAESFLVTRYERLVDEPEREARRMIDFCGLDWEDKVLDFHASRHAVATASTVQVRRPIYKSAVGRWKHYERELEPLIELFAEHGIDARESRPIDTAASD